MTDQVSKLVLELIRRGKELTATQANYLDAPYDRGFSHERPGFG